jgi:glycosyltransferase involved in cell wall biosynthesis
VRILHLTTFLQGGAGLAIAELACSQAALGHDVVVVTSKTGAPGYGNYPSHLATLARAGVPMIVVDSLFERDLPKNLDVVRVIQKTAGRSPFDVIHSHAATPSLIALILRGCRRGRPGILQTMHGWGVAKREADERVDVAILNMVDRVIVPAESSAALLRGLGVTGGSIGVVPYGVRDEPPAAVSAPDSLLTELHGWRADGGLVFCCVGTIGPRKNQRVLVDALGLLEERDRVKCVFVGDGDAEGLWDHALATRIEGAVRIAGYRDDARPFLQAADALVLPSLSEGQPLSILEAWRDRLPVIVSDIPELAELVDDGVTGFLFNPRDPRALASAMLAAGRLTPAVRLAFAARTRQRFEKRFTAAGMVAGYMNEYAAVAGADSRMPSCSCA